MSKETPLPHRDSVTSFQVRTLLDIANVMAGALIAPLSEFTRAEMDGEAKLSAAATFIGACSRLDDIISDKSRWDLENHDTLEKKLSEVYTQNLAFLTAQTEAAKEVNSPHFIYRPLILKLNKPGAAIEYVAILGDPKDLDNCIIGVGITPKQALEAFDGMFTGNMPDHLVEWLAQREAAIEATGAAPMTPMPKRKKKK